MEDQMQYIDDFFQGKLPDEEARAFEEKIGNDPAFAAEVAFYLSAKRSARDLVEEEKKKNFKEIYQTSNGYHKETNTGKVRKLGYVARIALVAAMVTALVVTIFYPRDSSTKKLAENYIKENYQRLSVTMGRENEMQKGTDLYNEKKYVESLAAFESIIKKDSSSFSAFQFAGLSALNIPDYDKALTYFRKMESFRAQFANPAVLLQAATHLKRNEQGDKEQAKLLLQMIVDNDLDGKPTAERWLERF